MKNPIKALFDKISYIGVYELNDDSQFIIATNRAALFTTLIAFPYIFSFLLFKSLLPQIELFAICFYLATWIFTKFRLYIFAKVWFITVAYLHVFIISVYFGKAVGADIFFYLIPIMAVFIFSKHERWLLFFSVLLYFIFYFLTQHFYTTIKPIELPSGIREILYHSSVFIVLLFAIIFEYTFRMSSIDDQEKLKKAKQKIDFAYKYTKESIEYAALIQNSVVGEVEDLVKIFEDFFVLWKPKDTVGGDIWLFSELRHRDECLVMVIDCTGHGVHGAFVTMIVKSIEREIVSKLKKHPEFDISPAIILEYFNQNMKTLLKQEGKNSLSNAGFDGGIIYYDKREQILKYSGANTPLFYIDENGDLKQIKGDRYSVGYRQCDFDHKYKEHVIRVKKGMKFFCSTDGYFDQNGGKGDFPFGKRRFQKVIKENYTKQPMLEIQRQLLAEFRKWKNAVANNEQNDDITVIGFEIGKRSIFVQIKKEEIIKYEGVITQNMIATVLDNIKAKLNDIAYMGVISTITIGYCQNMMKYSKDALIGSREIKPEGHIEVQNIDNEYYEILAIYIVSIDDKKKIEPTLEELASLSKAEIKKRYKEIRKADKYTHKKLGGIISLYEIAKKSDNIEYKFNKINEDKYELTLKSVVKQQPKEKA